MPDARYKIENTNIVWHIMHVPAISTNFTVWIHSLFHDISNGLQIPQIASFFVDKLNFYV